jgi:uncharacterized protein (DUF1697 family)
VSTWICLLRGVNLGKQRQLPMAALRSALAAAGMAGVRTHLQSGNVIALSEFRTPEEVSTLVRDVIAAEFSLDVPVMTRSPADLQQIIQANPFAAQAAERARLIRVIFLAAEPPSERFKQLNSDADLLETYRVIGRHVYVDYVRGYHNTSRTASFFTRKLGVDGTERNWRTVLALASLAETSKQHRMG